MSGTNSQISSLQWMVDAGVPKIEVRWLEGIATSPKRHHPVAVRRMKDIHDMALAGLMATVAKPSIVSQALQ